MSFTLWHCGILIGETDFEHSRGRHKLGAFRPTPYGLKLYPRISCMLTAASDLKDVMETRGVRSEEEAVERASEFIEHTEPGQRIIDLGRALCDVELYDPKGNLMTFKRIAFSDLQELRALCQKLEGESQIPPDNDLPPNAPRYLVSVTLGKRHPSLPAVVDAQRPQN